jgi:hypothetical protein
LKCEKTKFATGPEVLANQKKFLELELEVILKRLELIPSYCLFSTPPGKY